jgi:hypothetical protein
MTSARKHRGVVMVGISIVCLWLACGTGDGDEGPKWNCLATGDGCVCTQLRPGQLPRPGVEYIDRCSAAQCCMLNSKGDETTIAICECINVADDCDARAELSQTKVVSTCPPP